jgi:hypothetical protein
VVNKYKLLSPLPCKSFEYGYDIPALIPRIIIMFSRELMAAVVNAVTPSVKRVLVELVAPVLVVGVVAVGVKKAFDFGAKWKERSKAQLHAKILMREREQAERNNQRWVKPVNTISSHAVTAKQMPPVPPSGASLSFSDCNDFPHGSVKQAKIKAKIDKLNGELARRSRLNEIAHDARLLKSETNSVRKQGFSL